MLRLSFPVGALAWCLVGCSAPGVLPDARAPLDPSRSVWMHIESNRSVRLDHVVDNEWRAVCTSPCDQRISPDGNFRLTGPDVIESAPFQIHAPPGDRVDLHVAAGSQLVRGVAITTVIVGPIVAVGALLVAAVQELGAGLATFGDGLAGSQQGRSPPSPAPNTQAAMGTAGLAGLVTLLGVVIVATSGTSLNGQDLEGVSAARLLRDSPALDAQQSPPATSSHEPTLMVPVLRGTF